MKPAVYIALLATLLGILAINTKAIAQQGCGDYKIKDAQESYDRANFNGVFSSLMPCLENGFDDKQKILAYKLLALTYLAIDSTQQANSAIVQMLNYNPSYEPESDLLLPYRFVNLVNVVKESRTQSMQVTSVSKKPEDLYKAPATVMVLTEEDIRQRGYTDLEILFNDLPGFDVSRTYAITYSNVFQRGYRSDNTERTLFMVDGIEENDLWSNIVYWATQIPITNVKRIEIVYGPASTIYGANAFLGVVNVITKTPKEILGRKKATLSADIGYGTYNTRYMDVTAAAKAGGVTLSVTGRAYFSDLNDLSKYREYDYNPADYDSFNYSKALNFKGKSVAEKYKILNSSTATPYFTAAGDSVLVTAAGIEAARNLDKQALTQTLNGRSIGYTNELKTYYLKAKMSLDNLLISFETWNLSQGTVNSANDNSRAGARNGNVWRPLQSVFYAVYTNELIKDKLMLINTSQYRVTEIIDQSSTAVLKNYSNQGQILVTGDTLSAPSAVRLASNLVNQKKAYWETMYYYQHSNQFRNELRLMASPIAKLDVIGGFEFRSSSLQGDYKNILISRTLATPIDTSAKDYGKSSLDNTPGGNLFEVFNLGTFLQGTYAVNSLISLTVGGRYDYSRIRETGGYGSEFNPRIALVYTPGRLAFKAIYATAFQDASSKDRYALSSTRRLANPYLRPDHVENMELSVNYSPHNKTQIGITAYYSKFSDIVEETSVPYGNTTTQQKKNTGIANIMGIQATATLELSDRFHVYANYTFTDATREDTLKKNETKRTNLIVGDIARHHINAGINGSFLNKRLNANLRFNYVGAKPVGPGTSVATNTMQPNGEFPAYMLLNGAISYQVNRVVTAQLVGNNLLNKEYSDPGARSANGISQGYRTPQKGINGMIRFFISL